MSEIRASEAQPFERWTSPRNQTTADGPLVYTVNEVAERLKVSSGTVRNMIDQGQLYAIRLHVRRIVVPAWAVEELVARPADVVDMRGRPRHD